MKRLTIELSDAQFALLEDQTRRSAALLPVVLPEGATAEWTIEAEATCSLMMELRRAAVAHAHVESLASCAGVDAGEVAA